MSIHPPKRLRSRLLHRLGPQQSAAEWRFAEQGR